MAKETKTPQVLIAEQLKTLKTTLDSKKEFAFKSLNNAVAQVIEAQIAALPTDVNTERTAQLKKKKEELKVTVDSQEDKLNAAKKYVQENLSIVPQTIKPKVYKTGKEGKEANVKEIEYCQERMKRFDAFAQSTIELEQLTAFNKQDLNKEGREELDTLTKLLSNSYVVAEREIKHTFTAPTQRNSNTLKVVVIEHNKFVAAKHQFDLLMEINALEAGLGKKDLGKEAKVKECYNAMKEQSTKTTTREEKVKVLELMKELELNPTTTEVEALAANSNFKFLSGFKKVEENKIVPKSPYEIFVNFAKNHGGEIAGAVTATTALSTAIAAFIIGFMPQLGAILLLLAGAAVGLGTLYKGYSDNKNPENQTVTEPKQQGKAITN